MIDTSKLFSIIVLASSGLLLSSIIYILFRIYDIITYLINVTAKIATIIFIAYVFFVFATQFKVYPHFSGINHLNAFLESTYRYYEPFIRTGLIKFTEFVDANPITTEFSRWTGISVI